MTGGQARRAVRAAMVAAMATAASWPVTAAETEAPAAETVSPAAVDTLSRPVAVERVSRRVRSDTLFGALAQAYEVNPQLNSQRAIVRQTDEGVPQALSGYRPRVTATAQAGNQFNWQIVNAGPGEPRIHSHGHTEPRS